MTLSTPSKILFIFSVNIVAVMRGQVLSRNASWILLFAAALLSLGSSSPAGEHSVPKTDVRLWRQWRGEKQQILDAVIEDFNCSHEHVSIHAQPLGPMSGTVAERMMLHPAAAGRPDIALVEREAIPLLADSGAIRPVEELIESSPALQRGGWASVQ